MTIMPRVPVLPAVLLSVACSTPASLQKPQAPQHRNPRWGSMPPKGTVGVVMCVSAARISISAGSADGVQIGDHCDITRAGSYVGTIRICKIDARHVATGVLKTAALSLHPHPGDLATRLSGPTRPSAGS